MNIRSLAIHNLRHETRIYLKNGHEVFASALKILQVAILPFRQFGPVFFQSSVAIQDIVNRIKLWAFVHYSFKEIL